MRGAAFLIKPASGACNMNCKYCFYADVTAVRKVKNYGFMGEELLEILIQKALTSVDEFVSFAFQGGEPTLVGLPFYQKVIELEKKHNKRGVKIFNSIQTNGYRLNREWADFFAKENFLVGISLDGPPDIHNRYRLDIKGAPTFNAVMNSARLFDECGVQYNILCVVNRLIAFNAKAVYDFFKENNFRYLQFIPCLDGFDAKENEFSLSSKNYAHFLKTTFDLYLKDYFSGNYISVRNFDNYVSMLLGRQPESCDLNGVCSAYFVVEGDGSVYPCDFYVLDEYSIGNIAVHELQTMIDSSPARDFRKLSLHVDDKCRQCEVYPVCRGGCRRHREPLIEGHLRLNKYCEAYLDFFTYARNGLNSIASDIREKQII